MESEDRSGTPENLRPELASWPAYPVRIAAQAKTHCDVGVAQTRIQVPPKEDKLQRKHKKTEEKQKTKILTTTTASLAESEPEISPTSRTGLRST